MERKCFVISEARTPKNRPMPTEMATSSMKLRNTMGRNSPFYTACSLLSSMNTFLIVWKRTTATASLNKPSPKMIENSCGCSSYFTKVTAAMMSELHRIEEA